jgi:signal transduction histidine kinase
VRASLGAGAKGGEIAASEVLTGHVEIGHRSGAELTLELGQVVAAWPLGASLAAAAAARGLHAGRRRTALNEALHELRRPLQVLALAAPGADSAGPTAIQGSVQMAASALARLEREINGEAVAAVRAPMFARPLLDTAVARWQARAALAGGSLSLRWQAGEAMIDGDRCEVAQALDNLIVNAIEHGGPEIVVEATTRRGRFRVAVLDSGRESQPESRRELPAELVARVSGRRLRGHGLRVVRRTAVSHGGEFRLHSSARGTEAVFELPLSREGRGAA